MPAEFREIHVFHSLAIDVDFEIIEELRSPFRHLAFGAVTLVYKWRDNRENRFSWRHFELAREPSRLVRYGNGHGTTRDHFG
jgi:hypothetical protein